MSDPTFDDPLRDIAVHLGEALINTLSEGERDDGRLLTDLEAAAQRCASMMDDSEAFVPIYAAYEFLGGDVPALRGMVERPKADTSAILDAVKTRVDDMPI